MKFQLDFKVHSLHERIKRPLLGISGLQVRCAALTDPEVNKVIDANYVVTHRDLLERGDKVQTVENPGGEQSGLFSDLFPHGATRL